MQSNMKIIPEMPSLVATNSTVESKELDEQIQLVETIQQILLTEEMKLEMMLKQFHTRNEKRMSQEPTKKRRGRPLGSKNKKTRKSADSSKWIVPFLERFKEL